MTQLKLTRRGFIKASAASLLIHSMPHKETPEPLPPPDYDNTFYMLPVFEPWHVRVSADIPLRTNEAQEMVARLGPQRPYMRLGFAIISNGSETETYALAEKLGIGLALQGGATDHHISEWDGEEFITGAGGDRRNAQWMENGDYIAKTAGDGFRLRACLSVYCGEMHNLRHKYDAARATQVAVAMKRFPDTVVATSGPIEVETQMEGEHFGDYSPFTLAEFRDWLTHRKIYDDRHGTRKGQGFPGGERWRDDPTPDVHTGVGPSFNAYFGTTFKTWSLAYWDIEKYPDRLPIDASGMPNEGENGFIPDGFDAPRIEQPGNPFWQAWSDSDLSHPGFRQILIRQWVSDATRWLHDAGIPKKRVFSHQVPGQSYGDQRLMLGASPAWTAATPDGSIGITTYFGAASDTAAFSQIVGLNPNWGVFEYHPYPINSLAAPPDAYSHSLNVCTRFRSHILTPISWQDSDQDAGRDFIVRRGPFADAINHLFNSFPDRPYSDISSRPYEPPPVLEVSISANFPRHTLSWSAYIWRGGKWRWSDLHEFDGFQVWKGNKIVAETKEHRISVSGAGMYRVTVRWNAGVTTPPAVSYVSAENGTLRWMEPGGLFVRKYKIEFAPMVNMRDLKSVLTTSNEFPLPAGERKYYCRVCSVNGDGTRGPFSSIVKVALPINAASNYPPVVNVLAYGKNMSGKMLLSWSDQTPSGVKWKDMPGFVSFCIYHGSDRNLSPSPVRLVAKTKLDRYMDDHFSAEKPWYRVTALFQNGKESPPSDGVTYVP